MKNYSGDAILFSSFRARSVLASFHVFLKSLALITDKKRRFLQSQTALVTFLSNRLCHWSRYWMRADQTNFKSVMPSMIFSIPSISSVRMQLKGLARSIPYHRHPLAQRGRNAGLAAGQLQGLGHAIT